MTTINLDSYSALYQKYWLSELQSQTKYQALKISKKESKLTFGLLIGLDPERKLVIFVKDPTKKERGATKKVTFLSHGSTMLAFSELHKESRTKPKLVAQIPREAEVYLSLQDCSNVVSSKLICYKKWSFSSQNGSIRNALISEYMNLGSLKHCFIDARTFTASECKKIVMDIALAVLQMHGKKVYHNDIKEDNVLVHKEAAMVAAKLCDLQYASNKKEGHTTTGSPLFMSPEKLCQERSNGNMEKDDIWALGMLFSRILRGSVPSMIANIQDLDVLTNTLYKKRHRLRRAEPCPDTFKHVIWTMFDPNPLLRPSMTSIYDSLSKLPESEFFWKTEYTPFISERLIKSLPTTLKDETAQELFERFESVT